MLIWDLKNVEVDDWPSHSKLTTTTTHSLRISTTSLVYSDKLLICLAQKWSWRADMHWNKLCFERSGALNRTPIPFFLAAIQVLLGIIVSSRTPLQYPTHWWAVKIYSPQQQITVTQPPTLQKNPLGNPLPLFRQYLAHLIDMRHQQVFTASNKKLAARFREVVTEST